MSPRRDPARERDAAIAEGRQSFAAAIDGVMQQLDRRLGVGGRRHWVLPIAAAAAGVGLAWLLRRRLAAPPAESVSPTRRGA